MAESITIKALQDASLDAKSLEEVVNGSDTKQVTTRLGENYPSVKKAIKTLFENGGLPAEPFATKALMTASALVDGEYAQVTDDTANNGLYVKTAGAWVKSDYDPLGQANTYTDGEISSAIITAADDATAKANTAKTEAIDAAGVQTNQQVAEVVTSLNVSALLNRYDLTFAEAVEVVPSHLRKKGLRISYNNNEVREYININLTHWDNERFWLRPKDNYDGRLNHFDLSMIYNFNVGTGSSITYGEGKYCAIIPLTSETAKVSVFNSDFTGVEVLPLSEYGHTSARFPSFTEYTKKITDTTVGYVAFNLSNSLATIPKFEIAKNNLVATYGSETSFYNLGSELGSETKQLTFNPYLGGIHKTYASSGSSYSSRFFKESTPSSLEVHPEALFQTMEIQRGHYSLYHDVTGQLLRVKFARIENRETYVRALVSISYTGLDEDFTTTYPASGGLIDEEGFAELYFRNSPDGLKVRAVVNANLLSKGANINLGDTAEVHPRLIRNSLHVSGFNEGVLLKQYEDVGVGIVSSNMSHEAAQPFTEVRKVFRNGSLSYNVQGEVSKQHQQSTLISSKTANFKGISDIYVDAVAAYPNNPKVSVLREPSKAPYTNWMIAGRGLLGKSMQSQWIHPDICYVPEAVGGYKYWQVNSNFPNGHDRQEDADLFVSNNGIDWTRVKSLLEEDDGVGFRLPATHWENNYPQGFMAIPNTNNTFEFAFDGEPVTKKITGYLNHDPSISTHNGYVNVYICYNIGVVNASYPYRFVVCYRTNNGVDWEIVRADGTSFPYNEANAQLIFTKTNGVRNHISFTGGAGNEGTRGVSPQIVKVSDTEWYFYAREDREPVTGSKLYLARYRGTSPYSFDWANPEGMSTDTSSLPRLWHFGMSYINGLYYCMIHGYLLTSTDGVNFNAKPNQMFWRGMSSDLYKASFCVGHDGKVKVTYGIQSSFSVPHPLNASYPSYVLDHSRVDNFIKITSTLLCEFSSLQDMVNRAENPVEDAYVDVVVMVIDQASRSTLIRIIPCVRDYTALLQTLPVSYDDEVYVSVYMNSRNGGKVALNGVALNIANAGMQ